MRRRYALLAALAAMPALASAAPVTIAANQLVLDQPIVFAAGSDGLAPASEAPLAQVAAFLVAKPALSTIRIEVHGDGEGDAAGAQALTERRAAAVARWLVGHGVECARLLPVGFGATKPVAAGDGDDARAADRRTEFHVAALAGHPIGGMPADGGGRVAGDPCR